MDKGARTRGAAFILLIVGTILFWGGTLQAEQGPKLELKTVVEQETKIRKQRKWVLERRPVDRTKPGDTLVYTITYANTGNGLLRDAVIVNPLPREVVANPESAGGKDTDISCSIDNGRSFHAPPIMVQTKRPDGTLKSSPATPDRYTHIRWLVKKPLQPGQTGTVSFKATVK
jgi:uncharacterized repeat protein (TIGR01451 family)